MRTISHTVYTLVFDSDDGISAESFGSEAEREQRIKVYLEEAATSAARSYPDQASHLKGLLAQDHVQAALIYWHDHMADMNSLTRCHNNITIPVP